MKPIKAKFLASAIAIAAMAPMASAQTQIADGLINDMATVGVEVSSYEYLTTEDTAQIKAILESDKSSNRKAFEIEQIVDTSMTSQGVDFEIMTPESSLRDIVEGDLIAMGVEVDVDTLPFTQVAEIKGILESEMSSDDQKERIMAIIEG
ncbi:hypothetical protein [Oceanibium sediminis]|uniref:hypothetical protein n=1 Tax=Oceanibium sediminis TaxID=2026339 RepID=UPI000DD32979|nr:hypothetical protein [Oceanibium sediminis]